MKYKYIIPDIPPSNNKFIGKRNNWEYQREKKQWASFVNLFCRPKPNKPLKKAKVTILYHFKDKRRRDPDNYSGKMLLDGLVRSGIIIDDSFDNISLTVLSSDEIDGEYPHTEILVEEIVKDE